MTSRQLDPHQRLRDALRAAGRNVQVGKAVDFAALWLLIEQCKDQRPSMCVELTGMISAAKNVHHDRESALVFWRAAIDTAEAQRPTAHKETGQE